MRRRSERGFEQAGELTSSPDGHRGSKLLPRRWHWMAGVVSDPLLEACARDEAAALMAEFGAGAALFANGQVIEARRSGRSAVADFWSAVLNAVSYPPSAHDLKAPVPTAPDRVTHRPWQDDAAVARRSGVRDAVAMDAKRASAKGRRAGLRY